ncbi:MAG: hypothetical protein QOE53_2460 [Pseudonocardiales bacterium]|nr:hypothetical protein [Pseudonocardiales bacterium]
MPDYPALERADVLAMLAELGTRGVGSELERLTSMEVAWLVHQVEQRYGVELDLDDEELARLRTVSDAVSVLDESVRARRG